MGLLTTSLVGCSRALRGWPKGYVSLTYDDGLESQLEIAAPQLERAGFRGTFYLTWNNMKDRAADWTALARRGHELANHSVSHPCDLQDQSVDGFKANEIDPLQNWLRNVEGAKRAGDYAYPCDVTNLGRGNPNEQADTYARLLKGAGILRARTSEGPPNTLQWTQSSPYRLQAFAFGYDTNGASGVTDYIAKAVKEERWAILVFHEIGTGKASDGVISPAAHEQLLAEIAKMRVPCGTVQSAIAHGGVRPD
ncbi:MAG TPA: polysaccharide deacetylase family protein [Sphingomicrobium sp.]|nr:polysaccharide deacetylase family protein [Sphingomicrobium sp.]